MVLPNEIVDVIYRKVVRANMADCLMEMLMRSANVGPIPDDDTLSFMQPEALYFADHWRRSLRHFEACSMHCTGSTELEKAADYNRQCATGFLLAEYLAEDDTVPDV